MECEAEPRRPGRRGRQGAVLLLAVLAVSVQTAGAAPRFVCAEALAAASNQAGPVPPPRAKAAASGALSEITALVVFTGFRGQQTGVPSWAESLFDPDHPGSVSHFYREMSFGSLTLHGTVAPRRYLASGDAADYAADSPTEFGRYWDFVEETLGQVDEDLDLARFDNDGPDGRPDSGDDDGQVDLVVILTPRLPRNFILGGATGIALRLHQIAATSDPGFDGRPIGYATGLVAQGRTLPEAAGTVAHELGHALFGLPDLYSGAYLSDPAEDSAGIGNWGLMGWGALGWGGDDGPVSFSAWSRLRLGWAQVTEVASPSQRILVRDVAETGELVRIPAGAREYFLLEYRTRSSFYDRGIPAEGLLIWHVTGDRTGGVTRWQVDLECADGRWTEAGFPAGRTPDPLHGGDNLDFWARDGDYARSHAGNLGDATDVFGPDGRTGFTAATNPSSADREGRSTFAITAIERTARGIEALVEISGPSIEFEVLTVQDQTGDSLLVAGEEAVVLFDAVNRGGLSAHGATLTLESEDGLFSLTPERHELPDLLPDVHHPAGVLERPPRILVSGGFASWQMARLRLTALAGADTIGRQVLGIPVISARQEGFQWQVRDWQGADRLDPGDLFLLDLRLASTAPDLLPALSFSLSSPSEGAARVSDGIVRFAAEGPQGARSSRSPEFLALAGAAGTELSFVLEVRTPFQVWTDTAAFAVTRRPDITPPRVERLRLSTGPEGLIVQVRRHHILEGSEIHRVSARIHGLPDSTLRAELPMVGMDAAYQARWEGPAGTYSVTVEVEDANGNIGRSEAGRIEIEAAGEPPGMVESGLAGAWRPEEPAVTHESRLLQVDARRGGAWYGRTNWRVWRSLDEGASWHPTSFMLRGREPVYYHYLSTVHGDVEDPLTAYVIEGGNPFNGRFEAAVFATLDGGNTWSPVPMPDGVVAAFVDGYLPGRLYAASDDAVFLSDDWGRSWTRFPVEGRALGVWSHPADRERTYAWVYSEEGSRRLWRLDEGGAGEVGYNPVRYGGFLPVPDPWTPGGFHVLENHLKWIADAGTRVWEGTSLHHTSDEGTTWRALDLNLGSEIMGLAVSDSEPGLLYAHTAESLFRSHDGGETWQGTAARFDLFRYDSLRRVSAFGPSGLTIQTSGAVYVSRDRGETAVPLKVETPPPVGTVWFDDLKGLNTSPAEVVFQAPWDSRVLIAPLGAGYLRRSTTGGETWELLEIGGGSPYFDPFSAPRPSIFADPWRSGVVYLADESLWQSTDRGESWERMGPYADLDHAPAGHGEPQVPRPRPGGAVLASRDTLAVLYGDSLWVGHKDGRDWRVVGRLEPGVSGLDLARHPEEPGVLYAAADAGCFVSADGGRTWRQVLNPRTGSWRTARLRGHPVDADALYLAADRELYHSPDRGATWRALDPGYSGVPWINDVAVDPRDLSTLYVATSAGLYSLENPPTAVGVEAAVPLTTDLLRSYPNPFNASTLIPFRLGSVSEVRIDIYNLLGQRVRRLLDERRTPGLHRVRWSGTDDRGSPVSSGVYFYRLTTGEVAETRRCMLIR